MKPNKTRIRKLIAALRSGKYKQGIGSLRSGNKFCCLGVACELYRKEKGGQWEDGRFLGHMSFLPREVQRWYGFLSPDPRLENTLASHLNDQGYSFLYIANRFEETYIIP